MIKPNRTLGFAPRLLCHIITINISPIQVLSPQKSFTQIHLELKHPGDFPPCKFGVKFHEISNSQNTLETLATQTYFLYQLRDDN